MRGRQDRRAGAQARIEVEPQPGCRRSLISASGSTPVSAAIRVSALIWTVPTIKASSRITVDNFEGVPVVRGEGSATIVYMLSDDNFNFLQRTLLLLFRPKGA